MSFVKGLLGFIGRTFIGLGLTLFIFSFFANYAIADINIFQDSLENSIIENMQAMEGYNETKEYCSVTPSDEACDAINNPSISVNPIIGKITDYGDYIIFLRRACFLLFIIGFGFIYLANQNFILALYKTSFSSTIISAFAIFYYRYLPLIINSIPNNFGEIPAEVYNNVLNIMNNWLYLPLQKTYSLAILSTLVFLVITVVLFFLKRKLLNKEKKDSKKDEKRNRDSGRTEKKV